MHSRDEIIHVLWKPHKHFTTEMKRSKFIKLLVQLRRTIISLACMNENNKLKHSFSCEWYDIVVIMARSVLPCCKFAFRCHLFVLNFTVGDLGTRLMTAVFRLCNFCVASFAFPKSNYLPFNRKCWDITCYVEIWFSEEDSADHSVRIILFIPLTIVNKTMQLNSGQWISCY